MRKTIAAIGVLLALASLRWAASAREPGPADDPIAGQFTRTVAPFVDAHCVACHDRGTRKGDLDLSV